MKTLFAAAAGIEKSLQSLGWRFAFIGGIALQRWGQPRLTNDIDLTVFTGFGNEEEYIDHLLNMFQPRIDDAKNFALTQRVLLLSAGGVPVDVALGGVAFEELLMERATQFEFLPGLSLRTCSAEDLIVLKAFADRLRDWADIETVIIRQGSRLDWNYILAQIKPLCELKNDLEIEKKLFQMKQDTE
jgi:predicted nucleotidyltransferase